MGTIVFPNAGLKVFLTASLEERSRRRLLQEGRPLDKKSIRGEALRISKRDETDMDREVAPLKKPVDALEIDTTDLSFETQVVRIVAAASALTWEATEK
jgi:cytidylate kinase